MSEKNKDLCDSENINSSQLNQGASIPCNTISSCSSSSSSSSSGNGCADAYLKLQMIGVLIHNITLMHKLIECFAISQV